MYLNVGMLRLSEGLFSFDENNTPSYLVTPEESCIDTYAASVYYTIVKSACAVISFT